MSLGAFTARVVNKKWDNLSVYSVDFGCQRGVVNSKECCIFSLIICDHEVNVGCVTLSIGAYTASIQEHSEALAELASNSFDRPIEHCPGWTVEDLMRHLIETHWFWATIVEGGLSAPPDEGRPTDIPVDALLGRFNDGAVHLVDVLSRARQSDHVWTWAPLQKDVAFITRHQVQEVAVHHWDIAHAAGEKIEIAGEVANDAIAEFLSFSVSSWSDPADPPRAPLAGTLGLWCEDLDSGWTVHDGRARGTVTFRSGVEHDVPTLSASSSDLLLWLYSRVNVHGDPVANALGRRLQALSFTS
jgi:uncharacterized protein (TIGR03083 family)